ncbi:MAG: hypothetical protein J5I93_26405 [Pirellulaceae bacterium]|nr:hypothetical protein [Pirellulaceae bacterium]
MPGFAQTRRQQSARGRCRPGRRGTRRAGYSSLLFIMLLVIGVTSCMLVVNWAYVVMISRRTQQMTDVLAMSSVEELLDEGLLQDDPITSTAVNQADDVVDAAAVVDDFREKNNLAAAGAFRLAGGDVEVRFGYVADMSQPVGGANFDLSPPAGATPAGVLFNTLLVEALRKPGGNPVEILWRGFGTPEHLNKLATASYATLDNRLVGFRPTATLTAPLVPLAVEAAAWSASRKPGGMLDEFTPDPPGGPLAAANGIVELDLFLENPLAPMPMGTANCALVDYDGSAPLGFALMPGQTTGGVTSGQIAGGELSPAMPGWPDLPATQTNPLNVAAIVAAFDAVAGSANPRRVFPLYGTYNTMTDEVDVVGFIGATVLEAELQAGPRLRVRIEPNFVVHPTAVTDPTLPDADANVYIHKLRLSR